MVKVRISPFILRATKPKEFTGELPDDQRKKLRLNKCFWEHEAKYHREQAEAPKRSVSVPLQV